MQIYLLFFLISLAVGFQFPFFKSLPITRSLALSMSSTTVTKEPVSSEARNEQPEISNQIVSLPGTNPTNESNEKEIPLLPLPKAEKEGETRQLPLGGTVKMDYLGPMIINTDGTVRRIANWQTMTPAEQANTVRLITARNKRRLEALKQQAAEAEAIQIVESSNEDQNDGKET
jgi:hypothetical protein